MQKNKYMKEIKKGKKRERKRGGKWNIIHYFNDIDQYKIERLT